MEHRNKTKEERFQLIVEMSYILLRFLVLFFGKKLIYIYKWAMSQLEFEIYNVNTELRMKEILGKV